MPQGLALGADGVLAGTPAAGSVTADAGTNFTVVGTYLSKTGQKVYTIKVGGVALEAVQIATGEQHACAITIDGGVKCWGYNRLAQLGDGTMTTRPTPVSVQGLASGVQSIAAGKEHSCAVTTAGAAKCWGQNTYGQLGNGTTVGQTTPVAVQGLGAEAQSVAAGGGHTCVLTTGGALKCWGYNVYGQLGDGTSAGRRTPAVVQGLDAGVHSVATGSNHTCALTAGGTMKCWGQNSEGTVGDGSTTHRNTPAVVQGLGTGVQGFSTSHASACAVTSAGALKCWGRNNTGQLGDGTNTQRNAPVAVLGLGAGVQSVAPGINHTCAITSGGAVKCWGQNGYSQLGDGTTAVRNTPVAVQGLDVGVRSISAGWFNTCAITVDGTVRCWGRNNEGQLGDATHTDRSIPVQVKGD